MKKISLLLFVLVIQGFVLAQKPNITSLSKTSLKAGDTLVVSGSSFGTIKENIILDFNGIRGSIVSVTDSELKVEVPRGAFSGQIHVKKDGLVASSKQFVTIGSLGSDTLLVDSDFEKATSQSFSIGKIVDVNNDQLLDVISTDNIVWLNTNTSDFSISNFSKLDNSTFDYYEDVDNDGDIDGINVGSKFVKELSSCSQLNSNGSCKSYWVNYFLVNTVSFFEFENEGFVLLANEFIDTVRWKENTYTNYNPEFNLVDVKIQDLNLDGVKEIIILNEGKVKLDSYPYRLGIDIYSFDGIRFQLFSNNIVEDTYMGSSVTHKYHGLEMDIQDLSNDGFPEIIVYHTTGSTNFTYYVTDVFHKASAEDPYVKYGWSYAKTVIDAPYYFNTTIDYNLDGEIDFISNGANLYKYFVISGATPSDNSGLTSIGLRTATHFLGDINGDFIFDEAIATNRIDSFYVGLVNKDLTTRSITLNHKGYGTINNVISSDLDQNGKNDLLLQTSSFKSVIFLNKFESAVIVLKPEIDSVNKSFAKTGDTLTIYGQNLETVSGVQIGANEENLTIVDVSTDSIRFYAGQKSGELNLIYSKGSVSTGEMLTVLKAIEIATVTEFINDGETITINGNGFVQDAASIKVYFGETLVSPSTTITTESFSFTYLSNFGNGYVSVVNELDSVVSSTLVRELKEPTITNTSLSNVSALDTITINGTNFFAFKKLTVDGISAEILSNNDNEIIFVIPAKVTEGKLQLETQGGEDIFTFNIKQLPVIVQVSSYSVLIGDTVYISGANFLESEVFVNDTLVVPFSINDSSIVLLVQEKGLTGKLIITNDLGSIEGGVFITKRLPVIETLSLDSTVVGDTLTITGKDLDAAEFVIIGLDTITASSFLSQTSDSISFLVPSGALTGAVFVGNSSGISKSLKEIAVKISDEAPIIFSVYPNPIAKGETLFITGKNLLDLEELKFGGDFVLNATISDELISFEVPLNATKTNLFLKGKKGVVLFDSLKFDGLPKFDKSVSKFKYSAAIEIYVEAIGAVDSVSINDFVLVEDDEYSITDSLLIIPSSLYLVGDYELKLYSSGIAMDSFEINIKPPFKANIDLPSNNLDNDGEIKVTLSEIQEDFTPVISLHLVSKVTRGTSSDVWRSGTDFEKLEAGGKKYYSLKIPDYLWNKYTKGVDAKLIVIEGYSGGYSVSDSSLVLQTFGQNNFDLPIPVFGKKATDYRLYSFPFVNSNGLTRDYVFDEFKDKDYDSTFWRLVEYDSQITDTIRDLNLGTDELILGKGYLMAIANDTLVKIGGAEYATFSNDPITITLHKGWNLVGNPFPFPIDWKEQITVNDLKDYTSSDYKIIGLSEFNVGEYKEESVTDVYEGLFLNFKGLGSQEIIIQPLEYTSFFRLEEGKTTNIDSDKYELSLKVKNDNCNTQSAYIGVHPEAKSSYDRFDTPALPVLWESSTIDFGIKTTEGRTVMKSTVNSNEDKVWGFTARTCDNDFGTLEWNKIEGSKTLVLEDLSTGYKVDMSLVNQFNFSGTRRFKIVESEGVIDLENLEINLTPTLVRDQLLIQSNQNLANGYIVIIDAFGRETHFAIDEYSTLITLTEFPSGIYRVEIRTNTLNQTLYGQKIILE